MRKAPRAREIMNRRPPLLRPEGLVRDAARHMVRRSLVAAAVVDSHSRFVGVLSHHGLILGLIHAAHDGLPSAHVADYLEPPPPSLDENASLAGIAQAFIDACHAHPLLPVLRGERLVGTITRLDLARRVVQMLASGDSPDTAAVYLSATDQETAPFTARKPPGAQH